MLYYYEGIRMGTSMPPDMGTRIPAMDLCLGSPSWVPPRRSPIEKFKKVDLSVDEIGCKLQQSP
jgi:hypothetical protein